MKFVGQFFLGVIAVVALFTVVGRFDQAHNQDLPQDMPADAHFVASGYDLDHLQQQGNWIACRLDAPQDADFCRLTDVKGTVIYQGDFLPLSTTRPLTDNDLTVGSNEPDRMWVSGPAEEQPVPVIALANGERLVPAADRDALVSRWNQQPEEFARISATTR